MSSGTATSRLMSFLFTDLVNSTGLKEELGDANYVRMVAQPHNTLFRELLVRFPGASENNYTGDGFLATFTSVADAVNFGLLFHRSLSERQWERIAPKTRIGIHLGEATEFTDTDADRKQLAGQAVDLAARVMSLAVGGQTLLTRAAFDSARQYVRAHPAGDSGASELEWLSHGRYIFKGKDEPMEVFEVGVRGVAPLVAPADSEKAKRADSLEEQQMRGWRPALDKEIPRRSGWRIVEKLGEGGFGEVWLARHDRTKEERVFKFCFDPDRLRSFKREITLFRLIREHLGERDDIAKLLEVQVDQPPYHLESEYIPSGNLRQWSDRRGGLSAVPLDTRLRLLAAIARAVAAAHSLGIIHKDIKPSNVFVIESESTPRPRLADFGIGVLTNRELLARHAITETGFTESLLVGNDSSRTGTRLYAPPESQVGKPATTAGDVYALGVMLYQFVVGDLSRPLGPGWERDISDETLREDIAVSVDVEPTRRLASPADLAERLEQLDQRRTERQAQRRAAERERRISRLRALAITSLSAAVVVGWLAILSYTQSRRADREAALAHEQSRRAYRQYYVAQMRSAQRVWEAGDIKHLRELLEQTNPEHTGGDDVRGFEWYYWTRMCNSQILTLKSAAPISHVIFSADGRHIVTIGTLFVPTTGGLFANRAESKVWNAVSGELLMTFEASARATATALSRDGRLLAIACEDGALHVFDVVERREALSIQESPADAITFSPDGTQMTIVNVRLDDGQTVRTELSVRNTVDGRQQFHLKRPGGLNSCVFDPDASLLAGVDQEDRFVRLFRVANFPELVNFPSEIAASQVAFITDERTLASVSISKSTSRGEASLTIWDTKTGQQLRTFDLDGQVQAFSHNGECVATSHGGQDNSPAWIKLWDARSGRELWSLKGHDNWVTSVTFSPDGTRIAAGDMNGTVKLWSAAKSPEALTIKLPDSEHKQLAFSRKSTRAAAGGVDGTLRQFDLDSGQELWASHASTEVIQSIACSADGRRIASCSLDRKAKVWDSKTGDEVFTVEGQNYPECVAMSDDGKLVAAGANSDEDGRIVGAADGCEVIVWNVDDNSEVTRLMWTDAKISRVAFGPDGTTLAAALRHDRLGSVSGSVQLWDLATGTQTFSHDFNEGIADLQFDSTGRLLACGLGSRVTFLVPVERDFTVAIVSLESRGVIHMLRGHHGIVTSVSFSADGRRVASASWDKSVKIWDTSTGEETLTLRGHAAPVDAVAFSSDGRRIYSADWDGIVKIWEAR